MIPGLEDGPSKVLLRVIESCNGKAPGDWKGYRTMTEKWLFVITIKND